MKLTSYIRLFKFRYHISFITVIMGALVFSTKPLYALVVPLIVVYFSFNVLLYGGLYTLNDIADIEFDKMHPQKKDRPLPSGQIGITSAYILALVCILSGLIAAYLYFGTNMVFIYGSFIIINVIYTHLAKTIPYAEIFFNTLSHPMRFLLGIYLVTDKIPYLLLFALLSLAMGFGCNRRITEKKAAGWQARSVLKYYTATKLLILQIILFILIIIISIVNYPSYTTWYIAIMILYLIFVFGIYYSSHFIKFYQWLWLN